MKQKLKDIRSQVHQKIVKNSSPGDILLHLLLLLQYEINLNSEEISFILRVLGSSSYKVKSLAYNCLRSSRYSSILIANTLSKDLRSENPHIVEISLLALSDLLSIQILNVVHDDVINLLESKV